MLERLLVASLVQVPQSALAAWVARGLSCVAQGPPAGESQESARLRFSGRPPLKISATARVCRPNKLGFELSFKPSISILVCSLLLARACCFAEELACEKSTWRLSDPWMQGLVWVGLAKRKGQDSCKFCYQPFTHYINYQNQQSQGPAAEFAANEGEGTGQGPIAP